MSDYNWGAHVPGAHEIETYSGRYVDLSHPHPSSITLDDVAHGLANTCRYNGQVRFYSVAEHAVMVARRLERQGYDAFIQLAGLHHDDAEAFLGDVTRPLKSLLQPMYGLLSEQMDDAVQMALRLPIDRGDALEHYPMVKTADEWALFLEAEHLLPSRGALWTGALCDLNGRRNSEDRDLWTGGMDPWSAADTWLAHHRNLMQQIDDIEDARKAIAEVVA